MDLISQIQRNIEKFIHSSLYVFENIKKIILKIPRRRTLFFVVPVALLIFLVFLPELLFPFLVNRRVIIRTIEKKLNLSHLAVAYDGISISFYRGIVIHNFRISNEKDFSRGNILFKTDRLKWKADIDYLLGDRKSIPLELQAEKSELSIRIRDGEISHDIKKQIREWKTREVFLLELIDTDVVLNIKTETGKKGIFHIHFPRIEMKTGKASIIQGSYEDKIWGTGKISLSPEFSNKRFIMTGSYFWEGEKLPLEKWNRLSESSKFSSGYLTGKLVIKKNVHLHKKYRIYDTTNYEINTNIHIDHPSFQDYIMRSWQFSQLYLKSNWKINLHHDRDVIVSKGSGNTRGYDFEYNINYSDYMSLPEDFNLKITKREDEKIHLPHGIVLSGLESFTLKIDSKNTRNNPYRFIDSKLVINNGSLEFPLPLEGKDAINMEYRIPHFDFSLEKNRYKLNASIYTPDEKMRSDLKIKLNGKMTPFISPYAFRKHYEGYRSARDSRGVIMAWHSSHDGSISMKRLYYSHLKLYFRYFQKLWKRKLFETMNDRDLPGSLYYTKWYYQYILRFYPDININIDTLNTGKSSFKNISGIFKEQKQFIWLEFKDKKENFLKAEVYLASTFPGISLDFFFDSIDGKQMLSSWLEPELVKDFSHSKIDFHLRSAGVRAKELFQNYHIKGRARLNQFIPGSAGDDSIQKKWEKAEAYFYFSPNMQKISNFTMENKKMLWRGKAEYVKRERGKRLMNPYWNFKGKTAEIPK